MRNLGIFRVHEVLEQSKRATSVVRIGRKNSFRSYVECCLLWRQTPTAKLQSSLYPIFLYGNIPFYGKSIHYPFTS